VQLGGGVIGGGELRGEGLAVNGAVLIENVRYGKIGRELGGEVGAIVAGDHEGGSELVEERLLGFVVEAVVIGVDGLSDGGVKADSAEDEERSPEQSHGGWMQVVAKLQVSPLRVT
jgi:hypothetical protein